MITARGLRQFLRRPLSEKIWIVKNRWGHLATIPIPIRLPLGFLWVKRRDNLAETLLSDSFEKNEIEFVTKFLHRDMTVLDIGAHQGLYSLIASRLVGPLGRVFAFEPSPRERRALRLNLTLNLRRNVAVEPLALAEKQGSAEFFVVQGSQTGCNSLRPPDVFGATRRIVVPVTTLDRWISQKQILSVDFIKLDVEGAELQVLHGAENLLKRRPRPVILAEVQDVRTAPWGYPAKEILTFLQDKGFTWLRLCGGGTVEELDLGQLTFDGNFIAWPKEVPSFWENGSSSVP